MIMSKVKFIKLETDKGFVNGFTGRKNSTAYYAVNSLGQKGYLPNENNPYMPIGGISTLKLVLDILEWR